MNEADEREFAPLINDINSTILVEQLKQAVGQSVNGSGEAKRSFVFRDFSINLYIQGNPGTTAIGRTFHMAALFADVLLFNIYVIKEVHVWKLFLWSCRNV